MRTKEEIQRAMDSVPFLTDKIMLELLLDIRETLRAGKKSGQS